MSDLLRVYAPDECGKDGYPFIWHSDVKHLIREQAGHRCERCHHPYRNGEHGRGEWSRCDEFCEHWGPVRVAARTSWGELLHAEPVEGADALVIVQTHKQILDASNKWIEAKWRILTVHHLIGDKNDLRWWNLAALCQRCHLQIQGKVKMAQVYPYEHSDWMKPHAAGYYASVYLGEDLTREETMERLDELLALEMVK